MKIETDTGYAILNKDGSMELDNSGYGQFLTPKQVQAAWAGKKIPFDGDMLNDLEADYEGQELKDILAGGLSTFDGDWWDFGDESHTIPSEDEFTS